ncbi:MAG: WecB/TagA/CpsF family glycosyltransferase [Patescibacteria group bacterium]
MEILNIRVDATTKVELGQFAFTFIQGNTQHHLVSINPEAVVRAQHDPSFAHALQHASLALTDGFGIQLAAKLLKLPPPVRLTGVECVQYLCSLAATHGWNVYLFGGRGDTAERAAHRLRQQFPGLYIHGDEGIPEKEQGTRNKEQNIEEVIKRIRLFKTQILFVALGQPKQELWIAEHLSRMPSVKIAMGVGGAFDFLAGNVARAPNFIRAMGLEWLWRLILQPWRIFRIINATVRFMFLIATKSRK